MGCLFGNLKKIWAGSPYKTPLLILALGCHFLQISFHIKTFVDNKISDLLQIFKQRYVFIIVVVVVVVVN